MNPTPSAAPHDGRRPIRRALVSVSDKTGLDLLGAAFATAGVEVVSTGSTAVHLAEAGARVTPVDRVTGVPEILDGRVKTLHPAVHAGILADLRKDTHVAELRRIGVDTFDLVVVNLYPFASTVAGGADLDACVEQIDIGGPALLRAAAKNHASVAAVVDPSAYPEVVAAVRDGGFTLAQRRRLAAAAFAHTAAYDVAVASYLAGAFAEGDTGLPEWMGITGDRAEVLRYGENPHQRAALYRLGGARPGLAQAEQLHGKELSFNNYVDADAAHRAAYDHAEPCVAIVKHANPCGIALGADVAEAHRKAHAGDPVSAFGGVVAANRTVSVAMATQLAEIFTEVVVAPDYAPGALDVLRSRKNLRVLRCPAPPLGPRSELRPVSGGLLVQTADLLDASGDDPGTWRLASGPAADPATVRDPAFAWRAVRAAKSNAILLAHDTATVGIGMGQVNRVDAARLAVARAGDRASGSVAASDAFFPFRDGLDVLVDAGVRAVVQPGGSVRDAEVVAAAQDAAVTMYLTGVRHFTH